MYNSKKSEYYYVPSPYTEAGYVLSILLETEGINEREYQPINSASLTLRNIIQRLRKSGWPINEHFIGINCRFYYLELPRIPLEAQEECWLFLDQVNEYLESRNRRVA
jgi:hypothetical protein